MINLLGVWSLTFQFEGWWSLADGCWFFRVFRITGALLCSLRWIAQISTCNRHHYKDIYVSYTSYCTIICIRSRRQCYTQNSIQQDDRLVVELLCRGHKSTMMVGCSLCSCNDGTISCSLTLKHIWTPSVDFSTTITLDHKLHVLHIDYELEKAYVARACRGFL